jgi:hypothetical protein
MKSLVLASLALGTFTGCAAHAQEMVQWAAPASSQAGHYAYFPMGTALRLTTRTELNTKYTRAGDRFYLEVAEPLVYRGQVVVPAGSTAVGEVARSDRNGHFGKKGQLEVKLLYVQTPNGPVRLSGRHGRAGKGQGVVSIGGAMLVAWPMLFIHGTSGRLPADTVMTAYLGDELRFPVQPGSIQSAAAVAPDTFTPASRPLPASFDPNAFTASR